MLYQAGVVYAIYLPTGGSASLDLSAESGEFQLRWYDVEDGQHSQPSTVTAGASADLGTPAFSGDVAALVEKR